MRQPALAAAMVFCLTGCGAAQDTATTPPPAAYATSAAALMQKADSIALDSCTTRPPANAYPDCARYVAEAGNLALAAQSAGLGAAATGLAGAVEQFSRTGCVASPGVAGPPASTCGAVLRTIQTDVKALKATLDTPR